MKSSNQKYINQIPKRILISTLTFTFGFIFLILIPTVSSHLTAPTKLSSAQITGAYINGAIIVAVSLI
jgi:hypothetical protein